MRSSVLFPAPFSPMIATASPAATDRDTSSRASLRPNHLLIPDASSCHAFSWARAVSPGRSRSAAEGAVTAAAAGADRGASLLVIAGRRLEFPVERFAVPRLDNHLAVNDGEQGAPVWVCSDLRAPG